MKAIHILMFLSVLSLGLGLLLSCGGDDDDDDSGDDDNEEAFNSCDETATVLASPEQVSGLVGISADDLLEETGGGFAVTAAYTEDTSILTQSPLGGETGLTVTISYEGGEIREIESVPADDGTGQEIAADCRHRLEVEVTIAFATADGAFAETWQAVLVQSLASEGGGLDDPNLAAEFDPYALEGDFEIVSIAGVTPDSVTGAFSTTAVDPYQGSVDILVEQTNGEGEDGTVGQARHIALSWGDGDTDDDADDDGNVQNPVQSECLSGGKDEPDYTFAESLVIDFAGGALAVQHLNTCRNCEFAFEGAYTVEGAQITVQETDVEPMVALCDCPYNLSYSVPGIEASAYQFALYKSDQKQGMDPTPVLVYEHELDLTEQTHFEFDLGEHECI